MKLGYSLSMPFSIFFLFYKTFAVTFTLKFENLSEADDPFNLCANHSCYIRETDVRGHFATFIMKYIEREMKGKEDTLCPVYCMYLISNASYFGQIAFKKKDRNND